MCLMVTLNVTTFPKRLPPKEHVRGISNVNPIDGDLRHRVQSLAVELDLVRVKVRSQEAEVAGVRPILLAHPPVGSETLFPSTLER